MTPTDFKTNLTVKIDNDPWQVIEFQHVKPGKGAAFVRAKLRNLATGAVVESSYNPNTKMEQAKIDRQNMQYLYETDGMYAFMDNETFEQTELSKEQLGDALNFLIDNMMVKVMSFEGRILGVDLPNTVILRVAECEPGVRGNTATGATKNATMQTGYTIKVPLFIEEGEYLSIDTRTGDYIQRASESDYQTQFEDQ